MNAGRRLPDSVICNRNCKLALGFVVGQRDATTTLRIWLLPRRGMYLRFLEPTPMWRALVMALDFRTSHTISAGAAQRLQGNCFNR